MAKKEGTWRRKVQFVTGHNHDAADIRAGGAIVLGPFCYISEENLDVVTQRLKELYSRNNMQVDRAEEREFFEVLPQLSAEEEFEWANEYFSDPSNW